MVFGRFGQCVGKGKEEERGFRHALNTDETQIRTGLNGCKSVGGGGGSPWLCCGMVWGECPVYGVGFFEMKQVDEARLESDPLYRYEYLAEFIGFGPDDVKLIQGRHRIWGRARRHWSRRPTRYCCRTTRPRDISFQNSTVRRADAHRFGLADRRSPSDSLSQGSSEPVLRPPHQSRIRREDGAVPGYGGADPHARRREQGDCGAPGANERPDGAISQVLMMSIQEWPLAPDVRVRTMLAFNKLLWIQNDFINRHYARIET